MGKKDHQLVSSPEPGEPMSICEIHHCHPENAFKLGVESLRRNNIIARSLVCWTSHSLDMPKYTLGQFLLATDP